MSDGLPRRALLLAVAAAGTAVVAALFWRKVLRAVWSGNANNAEETLNEEPEENVVSSDIASDELPLAGLDAPHETDRHDGTHECLLVSGRTLSESRAELPSETASGHLAAFSNSDTHSSGEVPHFNAVCSEFHPANASLVELPSTRGFELITDTGDSRLEIVSLDLSPLSIVARNDAQYSTVDKACAAAIGNEKMPNAQPAASLAAYEGEIVNDQHAESPHDIQAGQDDDKQSGASRECVKLCECDLSEQAVSTAAPIVATSVKEIEVQTTACEDSNGQSVDADEAALFRTRGNKYYNAGRFEDALRCYIAATEKYPVGHEDRALAFANKAAALLSLERYEDAADACNAALAVSPRMVKALDRRSRALEHMGALDEALADALAAAIVDAQATPALVEHADQLAKIISEAKAAELYAIRKIAMPPSFVCRRFLESFPREWRNVVASSCNPESPLAHFYSALVSGAFEDAARLISDALTCNELAESFAAELLNWSGTIHLLQGSFETAVGELQHCADLLPEDATPRIKLALAAMEMGNEKDMNACIVSAMSADETNAAVFYHRGEIMALSGDMQAAVVDFKRAIQLDAEFQAAYAHQARAMQALGMVEDAEAMLRSAFDLFPDSFEIMHALGECLAMKSQHDEALAFIDAAIAVEPDDPQAHLTRAFILAEQHQSDNDLGALLTDITARFPYYGTAQIQLAAHLVSTGQIDEALLRYGAACEHARSLHDLTAILAHRTIALAQADVAKRYPELVQATKPDASA